VYAVPTSARSTTFPIVAGLLTISNKDSEKPMLLLGNWTLCHEIHTYLSDVLETKCTISLDSKHQLDMVVHIVIPATWEVEIGKMVVGG
jgi:hypothetical protein